jgi:quinol monooxygenase YgiN
MSRSVHVLATFESKSGKEREAEGLLRGLIEPTHGEEGCLRYILYRRVDRPGTFYFVEEWRSTADFRKHIASAHLSAVMARKEELFTVVDLAFVSPLSGGNPDKARLDSPRSDGRPDGDPAQKVSD